MAYINSHSMKGKRKKLISSLDSLFNLSLSLYKYHFKVYRLASLG